MGFFIASKLFALIGTPSQFLALMIIMAAILLNTRFSRMGRRLAIASAILFVIIGILPTGVWLTRPLENQYPRPSWPSHVDGVLVLGGGLHTAIIASRHAPATEVSEGRLVSAYELARHYPSARIVFSGGSGVIGGERFPEAQAAKYIFEQMGLDPNRLTLEDQSHNTFENISFSQKLVKPRSDEIWVLATAAIQLPRAMQVAERMHWKLIPWPTDYLTASRGGYVIFGPTNNLSIFDAAFHEWAGQLAYRWNNMTLPVPSEIH